MSVQTLEERQDFLGRCAHCNQCKTVASVQSQRFASSCPSLDYGHFHGYSASGQIIVARALTEGLAPYSDEMVDMISSCTMCGNCDVSCKINFGETVEPLDTLYSLRARLVADGQSPKAHQTMIANLRKTGNAAGRPSADRGQWADGLNVKANADIVVHVGSALAYDQARWPSMRTVIAAISAGGIAITHLGADEGSSGSTAFDLGYIDDAKAMAAQMVEQIKASGAKTLVTFSAAALAAFRGLYPRLDVDFGDVRVVHITEYLDELISAGVLKLGQPKAVTGQTIAYHDSCKLGRLSEAWQPRDPTLGKDMNAIYTSKAPRALRFGNQGCYEAPRSLLRAMGAHLVEFERNHAQSYCCGASGGVKEAQPDAAELAATNRLDEFADTGAAMMVSACSGCTGHMGAKGGDKVRDLLDLVAAALAPATV